MTQVLNRRGGPFTAEDEQRLKAFTAQVSIALQNAKLFDDVQNMRNYSEAMLASMSNGVITLDKSGTIATCNDGGARILGTEPGLGRRPAVRRSSAAPTRSSARMVDACRRRRGPRAGARDGRRPLGS